MLLLYRPATPVISNITGSPSSTTRGVGSPWNNPLRGPDPMMNGRVGYSEPASASADWIAARRSVSRTPGRRISIAALSPTSENAAARRMSSISAGDLIVRSLRTVVVTSTKTTPGIARTRLLNVDVVRYQFSISKPTRLPAVTPSSRNWATVLATGSSPCSQTGSR